MTTAHTHTHTPETSSPAELAVQVREVHQHFGAVHAVAGISLEVPTGQVLALLGHNGAGKTTLLDMILGFITPDSGTISVFGKAPSAATQQGLVGAVLQTEGLLKDLSVAETVRMVAACHRWHIPVDEVMERAGLTDFATRKVGKCSGGQAQRLRFGLALLTDPQLLILDEPTAGMDASARRDFWHTMHAEAQRGRTIIFATHYLREADDYANRVVLVQHGRVVADGTVAEMTQSQPRVLTGQWRETDAHTEQVMSPAQIAERFAVPTQDWSFSGQQVQFSTRNTDELAGYLLTHGLISDLQITHPTVEDVYFQLDDGAHQPQGDH